MFYSPEHYAVVLVTIETPKVCDAVDYIFHNAYNLLDTCVKIPELLKSIVKLETSILMLFKHKTLT